MFKVGQEVEILISSDEFYLSGPYTTRDEALLKCVDTSCWPELLTVVEALAKTY